MPYYSDELLDEIRSKNDIVDVIGQYVHLQKKGSTYFGLCPFHNEKTPSFSVTPSKQMFYCFGCGKGGNVFTFLMDYENLSFPEAVEELANRAGVTLPQREMTAQDRQRQNKRTRMLAMYKDAAAFYYVMLRSDRGKPALDYFRKRQLTEETMKNWGLGYSGKYSSGLYQFLHSKGYSDEELVESALISMDERRGPHDRFWNRAMFPIMDKNGKVIAFGGRVMGDGEPKYLNSPDTLIFNKRNNLFGFYQARKTRRKQYILCEGYMDVISMHQNGFDNTVASLGTALTEEQARLLKRRTDEVYLSYDSDGAGVKAALRAIPILKDAGMTCKVINMRPYKDPDEFMKGLGPDEYEKRIAEAENSFMFEIRMLERDYDLKDPESNTEFWKEVGRRVAAFPEEIERSNYIAALAEKYQRKPSAIQEMVVRAADHEGILARKRGTSGTVHNPGANVGDTSRFDTHVTGGQEASGFDTRRRGHPDDDFAMAEAYSQDDAERYGMDIQQLNADAYLAPEAAAGNTKTPRRKKNSPGNAAKRAQRLLLTWIVEDPAIYGVVKQYISPEDFDPGTYQKAAEEVFRQAASGRVDPAAILDHFSQEDEETVREVSSMFNTTVGEITERADRQKALKEMMMRIKRGAISRLKDTSETMDPATATKMVEDRRMLKMIQEADLQIN